MARSAFPGSEEGHLNDVDWVYVTVMAALSGRVSSLDGGCVAAQESGLTSRAGDPVPWIPFVPPSLSPIRACTQEWRVVPVDLPNSDRPRCFDGGVARRGRGMPRCGVAEATARCYTRHGGPADRRRQRTGAILQDALSGIFRGDQEFARRISEREALTRPKS